MKILLTGASGFIGNHLAQQLITKGYELTVLSRQRKNIEKFSWSNQVNIIESDITSSEQMHQCCVGQDVVIHLAGLAHAGSTEQLHQAINFKGTQNILAGAIASKVAKFIYISSSKAKVNSTPYGEAKHQSEQEVLRAHAKGEIVSCCLRPTAVYGPGMKGNLAGWINATKRGRAPPLPPVKTRIAMIGLVDLCSAIILAIENEAVNGKSYELSDGNAYNIKEIEDGIRVSLGQRSSLWYLPKPCFYFVAILGDILKSSLGISIGFNKGSYTTLFEEEYYQSPAFVDDSGFKAEQNFFTELDNIIGQM